MYGQDIEVAPAVGGGFTNVKEDFDYYDSVLVYWGLDDLSLRTPGWFSNFQQIGAANAVSFFDVRNLGNTDLAFCNVETRDMTAFPMHIEKIGVSFWSPANKMLYYTGTLPFSDAFQASWWDNDLPRHAALRFKVQQDEKLKTTAMMVPFGAGNVVGGYGMLSEILPSTSQAPVCAGFNQGVPVLRNEWQFPIPIQVPRRAALKCSVEINEYARTILSAFATGAPQYKIQVATELSPLPTLPFGITVSISGKREVQQRGALHA